MARARKRKTPRTREDILAPSDRGAFLNNGTIASVGQKYASGPGGSLVGPVGGKTRPKYWSSTLPAGDPRRGTFSAHATDPRTGAVSNQISGRLKSSPAFKATGGDRLAGTGIGNFAGDVGSGNLATGLRTGAQAGLPGATARPIAPPAASPTAARMPTVKDYPELARMAKTRAATNPGRISLFRRGGGKDEDRVAVGFKPNDDNPNSLLVKSYLRMQAQAGQLRTGRIEAEKSDVDFARTQAAEGQKIEGRVGLAEVKGGIKEKLQGLVGEQRQAVLTVEFKNDMEKFGITQEAKDAGREDDQVFQLEKLAERYKLAGENATTDDERDQADRLEFEALRAANDARKKTVTDPIFGATTIEFGEPNAPTDTGATQAPEDLQSGATDQEQKAWDMVRSTDPFTLSDQGEAALYQQWADYFRTKYNLDVKKFRPKESPANA